MLQIPLEPQAGTRGMVPHLQMPPLVPGAAAQGQAASQVDPPKALEPVRRGVEGLAGAACIAIQTRSARDEGGLQEHARGLIDGAGVAHACVPQHRMC